MKNKIQIALLTLPLLIQGCATATKSSLLGVAIGGSLGALIAGQQTGSREAPYVGAAVGASVGALIGYGAFKEREKKLKPEGSQNPVNDFPELTQPKLRSVWVPDKIEGNRYIKGHTIFVIEESGTWKKSDQ